MANNLLLIVLISLSVIVIVNCVVPSCNVCESATDENCKILNPASPDDFKTDCTTDIDVPAPEPNNVCYTLINGNDVTRKCWLDEPPSFQAECDANPLCFLCEGDNCNADDIAPLQCITCSSETDPNCATVRTAITTKTVCGQPDQVCFASVVDDITHRGCTSPTVDSPICLTGMCEKCTNRDNCNDAVYPADRLTCHHCNEHIDCNGEQDPTKSYACENYDENDKCYIIGMGSYAQRGCMSDSDDFSQNCANDNELCTFCNTPGGCNDENAVQTVQNQNCYFCDETNPFCFAHVNDDDALNVVLECKLFLKYDFKCFMYTSGSLIRRGCLNDIENITPPECIENPASCDICDDSPLCNVNRVLEDGDYCVSCSSTDPKCNDPEEILSLRQDCYSHPDKIIDDRCYLKQDTLGTTERGCVTDLVSGELDDCGDESASCKTCGGENCNQKLSFTSCYNCSSVDDVDCVNVGSVSKLCNDYLDICLTYVQENGTTVRGCKNELNPKDDHDVVCNSLNCDECDISNCNDKMFPADRLKCLKCASETDSDCLEITDASIAAHSVTCPIYFSDNSCYTIVTGNLNLTRGCLSDEDDAATECSNENRFCITCSSSNNCNTAKLENEPTLSCIKCNQIDPKCEWGFDENDAEPCTETKFFDETELCYTYKKDGEIARGCVLDDDICVSGDAACSTCGVHGCNSLHLTQSQCIVCDSSDIAQEFCESEIQEGDLTTCLNGNQLYEYRGCYTYKTDTHVHRGCVSTLAEEDLINCGNSDFINCDICYSEGCNNQEPNLASQLYYLSVITLICISMLSKLLN